MNVFYSNLCLNMYMIMYLFIAIVFVYYKKISSQVLIRYVTVKRRRKIHLQMN